MNLKRTILITGGTGSFGHALVDFFLSKNEKDKFNDEKYKILIYSRDEKKQSDMRLHYKNNPFIRFIIGDVRDKLRLYEVFQEEYIDTVFHAAALKQVPIGEEFPKEVIKTTILGIENVLDIAEEFNVSEVVNLSTDKAVAPVNAYGMAKALSEKIVVAHRGKTTGVNLRYGNVLGSRGSVIPLFIDQISKAQPLTVTNLNMTRFLLPLSEAVQLANICMEEGEPGDLFVIKSPACTVETLAEAIGKGMGIKYNIEEIGIRPGEKIHETLLTPEEVSKGEDKKVNGIIYTRVSSKAKAEDYSNLEPFTSENTIQYGVDETLNLLIKAHIL